MNEFAVIYLDQGPLGISTQDIVTTSHWTKVFLFRDELKMKTWISENMGMVGTKANRKNPRFHIAYPLTHERSTPLNTLEIIT